MNFRYLSLLATVASALTIPTAYSMPHKEDLAERKATTRSVSLTEMEGYVRTFYSNQQGISNKETLVKVYNQIKSLEEYLSPYIPGPVTGSYFINTLKVYHDLKSSKMKQKILHDGRPVIFGQQQILPGQETTDYGWNFPLIPEVHEKLLQFCAEGKDEKNQRKKIIDVGPGFGLDSLGMLLTRKAAVTALEKQQSQTEALKTTVKRSIQQNVDPQFPLSRFSAINADFLTFNISTQSLGIWDGINFNKVIHFFTPTETETFVAKAHNLLKPGGRVFITCLMPSPGSEIEEFMGSQTENAFPGYVFYKQRNRIAGANSLVDPEMLEVRKPKDKENPAYFLQTANISETHVTTSRVMHYHTPETLKSALGNRFRILDSQVIQPEATMGTDHMLSIVAEKVVESELEE